ncbi:hypothetical protein OQH60_02425 [Campylobacter sp. MIT 21-1685]|uniref:hypothetical protein n=1 Tax=unclassified Campylobacter TaxID=2593542 RepID=UPI00224AC763|nr:MULTISPECIES: hypothetical protein [unclassified Campylobacter]MCX2682578.1 hypothetical protein [Campylobacter sp. MIT 21-1684]MCX2750858.1 hypothetical protein [Campylobacter sp. MIT 21-1682]MCX2807209.1 hypothetical protein [Campylobacter sp. MIT 21-1685]
MVAFFKGIGVGFLGLVLFVLGVVFNVEFLNQNKQEGNISNLDISRNIETSIKIKPDILRTHIYFYLNEKLNIPLNSQVKEQLVTSFNQITQRVKEQDFCTLTDFSLQPNSYKEDTEISQKMSGYIDCKLSTQKLDSFNAFFSDLQNIVAKNEFISMRVSALEPQFSPEFIAQSKEKLYDELVRQAFEYEKSYSTDLNQSCVLKFIDLYANQSNFSFDPSTVKDNALEFFLPSTIEEDLKIEAFVRFSCK